MGKKLLPPVSYLALVFIIFISIFFVWPHVNTTYAQGGIFGGGNRFGSIFSGIREGIRDIFDSLGVGVPGGAIIPGISPPPAGGLPPLPGSGLPPVFDPSKRIKLTLEWDAMSVGTEAVDPKVQDPLESEHRKWLRCPPCPARPPGSNIPPHEGEQWHFCAEQFACAVSDIEHVLYGWCGHKPTVLNGRRTPGDMKKAYEGPNSHTLPSAVSNKYVRRDGYAYRCVRTCDDGICEYDNYMEFQTEIFHSNALSMYLRVENLSNQPIPDVLVKVNELSYDGDTRPLPHNINYPDASSGFNSQYVHGHNLDNFSGNMNGTPIRTENGQLVLGPFFMPPQGTRFIPLQYASSEVEEIPSAEIAFSPTSDFAQSDEQEESSQLSDALANLYQQVSGFILNLVEQPPKALAFDVQAFNECAAQPLANYLNTILNASQSGQIPSNVLIGTPIFNLTNALVFDGVTPGGGMMDMMAAAGANFGGVDVFMGTAYNINPGEPISNFVDRLKAQAGGRPIILPEIGMIEVLFAGVPRNEAIEHLREQIQILQNDPQIIAASLFASFSGNGGGWGNPDGNFSYNWLSNGEIEYVCGGPCGNIGINPGSFASDGTIGPQVIDNAVTLGMNNIVIMARAGAEQAVADLMNQAIAAGLIPILRIGTEDDPGGFTDPAVLAEFLATLGNMVNGTFYASGGPNEPDRSHWFAPECGGFIADLVGTDDPLRPGDADPGDPLDPDELAKKLGKGGMVPRDFNFVCDPDDDLDGEENRCSGAGGSDGYIIEFGSDKFDKYRDTTGIGGCGYWASSNNSVIGPLEVVAEYGGDSPDTPISRSVLLASIPIGGRIIDDQSRPYGWPAEGQIEQNWGFTGEAGAQGYYRFTGTANIDGTVVNQPSQDYAEFRCCGTCTAP